DGRQDEAGGVGEHAPNLGPVGVLRTMVADASARLRGCHRLGSGARIGGMAAPSTTLLIIGASGDLTSRLLLPGIATLLAADPGRRVEIVGADLRELGDDEW